jgi:dTDP-4-amino-4,6-dideoxygalactose transaminase
MSKEIPFLRLDIDSPQLEEDILKILRSGRLTRGPYTQQFEEEFKNFLGVSFFRTVNSGTTALYVALRAIDVKDKYVVVPALSFKATIDAVILAGGKPLVLDVDETYTLDINQLEDALKNYDVKVILPVHLFGNMADMPVINDLAQKYGAYVLEDAAQAHGASLEGIKAGAWGDIAAFSFYATKNISMGEGGGVAVSNPKLAEKVKTITDFGNRPAFNFRISEFQAAVGLSSLRRIEENNRRRREIAKKYNERLGKYFALQKVRGYHVYHVYSLRHPQRDLIIKKLQERKIGTKIYYDYLLHEIRAVEHFPTPKAEKYKKELFALPIYPTLTEQEVDFIIESLLEILEIIQG